VTRITFTLHHACTLVQQSAPRTTLNASHPCILVRLPGFCLEAFIAIDPVEFDIVRDGFKVEFAAFNFGFFDI
jgi:hypothetical protein